MSERTALFISHANPEDNVFTIWLGAKLAAAGYEVWADILRLIGGQDWQRKLEEALKNRAFKVLMVGTANGVNKQRVRNEIQIATTKGREIKDNEFIIPLKLEPHEAPFLIVHAQHIDFSKSWAAGLAELLETLSDYNVPKVDGANSDFWRAIQLVHGREPVRVEEDLVSNWLRIKSLPVEIHFYDFNAGISIGYKDTKLQACKIPVVPHNRGFLSFAEHSALKSELGDDLSFKKMGSLKTGEFLENGWQEFSLPSYVPRRVISNLIRQGIEELLISKNLTPYEMSNKKLCWFGPRGIAPDSQIKFGWKDSVSGRRQIIGFVTQLVRETTLNPAAFLKSSGRQLRPIEDPATVAWKLATGCYYKSGGRPWQLADVRPDVCYVGLVYKQDGSNEDRRYSVCAAQMFLSNGEGVVFRGALGPWYQADKREFHLNKESALALISTVVREYTESHGKPPKELFIHAQAAFSDDEWQGFTEGSPSTTNVVGIQITDAKDGLKLFRPSEYPVMRGMALKLSDRQAYLWTAGYVPRLDTYMGPETPNPISVKVIRGDCPLDQVLKDVLSLTKINFNSCLFNDRMPVTIKFANAVGDVLVSAPLDTEPKLPFKFYI